MAEELSKTDAALAAKTFATSTLGLLNDFDTRLDKLSNTADANVQDLHQEMRGLQKSLAQFMALMAKTQESAIEQIKKQNRQQIDDLKAKLPENSSFKEIFNRLSQVEKGFASITKGSSRQEVQKLQEKLEQNHREYAEKLRQLKNEITKATEKECSTQADREQVKKALSDKEKARDLPPCLSPETQQKIQEYEVAQEGRDLLMQQAQSMILMAMATGNPYVIAAAAVLTVIAILYSIFDEDHGKGNGNNGEGSGEGKQSGSTAQATNNTGKAAAKSGRQDGNKASPTQGSKHDGVVGSGTNGSRSSNSVFTSSKDGKCYIKKRPNTSRYSFIDVDNKKNRFTIEWDKIKRFGDNPVPVDPTTIDSWSCDFKNERITVTYGSECRAIQPAEDGDRYDSISSYLGGLCK